MQRCRQAGLSSSRRGTAEMPVVSPERGTIGGVCRRSGVNRPLTVRERSGDVILDLPHGLQAAAIPLCKCFQCSYSYHFELGQPRENCMEPTPICKAHPESSETKCCWYSQYQRRSTKTCPDLPAISMLSLKVAGLSIPSWHSPANR